MGFYVAFNGLGNIAKDRNPELGRNFVHFAANSSKGVFSCRRTIDNPPQRHTFINQPGQPACENTADSNSHFLVRHRSH